MSFELYKGKGTKTTTLEKQVIRELMKYKAKAIRLELNDYTHKGHTLRLNRDTAQSIIELFK